MPPNPLRALLERAVSSGRIIREDGTLVNIADLMEAMLVDLDEIAAGGGGGGGGAATTVQSTVIMSVQDTAGGQTSGDFVNSTSRGMLILVDLTARNGTGSLSSITLQTKTLSGTYIDIGKFASLNLTAIKGYAFYFYPGASTPGLYKGFSGMPLGRTLRIETTSATDNAGNDITYSVDAVMLP